LISKDAIIKTISYLIKNGVKATCEAFSITEETLNRYKRKAKEFYGDSLDVLLKLTDKFSIEELDKLSSTSSLVNPESFKKHVVDFSGEEITFGVMSDTHIGSVWTDPNYIKEAFKEMDKQKCTMLLHPGDICVPPNTLITTKKGFVPIQHVHIGDEVLTHRNRWNKVTKIYTRTISEDMDTYHTDSSYQTDLKITKNHPLFVTIDEKNHKIGDKVCFLESKNIQKNLNHLISLKEDSCFEAKTEDIFIGEIPIHDTIGTHTNNGYLKNNDILYKTIGIFLGDGTRALSDKRGTVSFSFNKFGRKIEQAVKIIKQFSTENGFSLLETTSLKENCIHYCINSKPLSTFFNQFYDEFKNKYLPLKWVNINISFFINIVIGLIETDGCITKGRKLRVNNTSLNLLKLIKLRLEASGIYTNLNLSRPEQMGRVLKKLCLQKNYYELGFYNSSCNPIFEKIELPLKNRKAKGKYERFDYIIKTIVKKDSFFYEGEVWNLEVEEDNSYIANNIIVHNCEGMMGRPGDIYELSQIGYKAQKEKAVEIFKQWEKPLYIVSGNHDCSYNTKLGTGVDIVEDICENLGPDAHYIGINDGNLTLNGVVIKLWHGGDGSCFDNKTEILTETGWKFFKDLNKENRVATMTKENHVFEWQKPLSITNEPYTGKMVHFRGQGVDCMVTPNHGMWTRVSEAYTYRNLKKMDHPEKSHLRLNTNWHRKNAGDLVKEYGRQKWQFTQICSDWVGETPEFYEIPYRESKNKGKKVFHFGKVSIENIAEFIAWYVTEGHAGTKGIAISQSLKKNPENHAQIVDLAQRMGMSYGVNPRSIVFHSTELADWIKKECGHLSRYKFLPFWLKNCDKSILRLVFDTMVKGDGWVLPGEGFGYSSLSSQLRDDIGEIAQKLGYGVTYIGKHCVSLRTKHISPTVNSLPEEINYSGRIYCCEVPNGLIYIRRNGKTLWTHNSYSLGYRDQKLIESFTGGEKPNILITGHIHKAYYFFYRNVHTIGGGSIQKQSGWMRSKKIQAHTGFWVVKASLSKNEVKWIEPRWYPYYV
jgi:hypothetical protein